MAENFPNPGKETDTQVPEVESSTTNKMNPKRPTAIHIVVEMAKVKSKEIFLKAARGKQCITYKEYPIRLLADFSAATYRPEESGRTTLKCLKKESTM